MQASVDIVQRRRPSKVSLPNVGVLSRTSKEIPIVINPTEQKFSREISVLEVVSPPKKP